MEAALAHDYALLERLVFASRVGDVRAFVVDPTRFSVAAGAATSCQRPSGRPPRHRAVGPA